MQHVRDKVTTPHTVQLLFVFHVLRGQDVADSPYSVLVYPGDAHGPSSSAYGTGVSETVATLDNTFYVQASAKLRNALCRKHGTFSVEKNQRHREVFC